MEAIAPSPLRRRSATVDDSSERGTNSREYSIHPARALHHLTGLTRGLRYQSSERRVKYTTAAAAAAAGPIYAWSDC